MLQYHKLYHVMEIHCPTISLTFSQRAKEQLELLHVLSFQLTFESLKTAA